MMNIKTLSLTWLWFIALVVIWYGTHSGAIESHSLHEVLRPGHDAFGRDCVKLTALAISESIKIVLPLSILCMSISLGFGLLVSMLNGQIKSLIQTLIDAALALPGFLIALSLGVLFSQTKLIFVAGAMIVAVPSLIRFFQGQLEQLAQEDFIKASQALGASSIQLLKTHYLREIISMVGSMLPFLFLRLVLLETSLSFLGLSATPNHETWGRLLYQGKDYFLEAPWILTIAGLPLILTLLSFHLLERDDEG